MFELIVLILFVWLSVKSLGLVFHLTWGAAKLLASLLYVLALPLMLFGLLFAGGLILLLPVLLLAGVIGIVKCFD
jgi:hypothetical protein